MNQLAQYSVVQFRPSADREEVINIGILVRLSGKWDVRLLADASKVVTLNPLYPTEGMTAIAVTLTTLVRGQDTFASVHRLLNELGGSPGLQQFVGQFPAKDAQQYESEIAWIMSDLVEIPTPKTEGRIRFAVEQRLRTKLRNHFKNQHLLAKSKDQIHDHKVVENFPIEEGKGLFAEFALKNTCMHITETVDFDVGLSNNRNKRLEAQAKTLVLSAAKARLGPATETYVVVSGSNRHVAKTSISLLQDYADVFALESSDDMNEYFRRIHNAANSSHPPLAQH
jgi:hypothetical protein